MGQATTTRPLLDFLYRDPSRVASLYAQVFGGQLVSAEFQEATKSVQEKTGGLSVHLVSGGYKSNNETSEGRKEVRLPHDTITTDLIHYLAEKQYTRADFMAAPNGALIRVDGSIAFGDGTVFGHFSAAMEEELAVMFKGDASAKSQAAKTGKQIAKLISKIQVPSIFFTYQRAADRPS